MTMHCFILKVSYIIEYLNGILILIYGLKNCNHTYFFQIFLTKKLLLAIMGLFNYILCVNIVFILFFKLTLKILILSLNLVILAPLSFYIIGNTPNS